MTTSQTTGASNPAPQVEGGRGPKTPEERYAHVISELRQSAQQTTETVNKIIEAHNQLAKVVEVALRRMAAAGIPLDEPEDTENDGMGAP